jgi:hypothetical protein
VRRVAGRCTAPACRCLYDMESREGLVAISGMRALLFPK